ncbi:Hypothetical protein MLTONO_p0212 (plasmid) [Mesorhizobium loti]|nr:Hypothetical protein MLTONO_p0212 [Mesorhizobium loti]BCH04956.1 hypothetical protein MesoLj131b_69550 [Mesorhizobium sp. 131-2-5]
MFTFPLSAVRAIIARGELDAAANGGYRNPHYGLAPGKDEKPGLWLVGDQGVYDMHGHRQATQTPTGKLLNAANQALHQKNPIEGPQI